MTQKMLNYISPTGYDASLRNKPDYILTPQTLNGVSATFLTKAANKVEYKHFIYPKVFMKLEVEINNNASLVDADYLEIFVQSGIEVDVNNKIVNGVTVPYIAYENDRYPMKQINSTTQDTAVVDYYDTVYADESAGALRGGLRIAKNSFAYQKDGTYYVTKYIAFPTMNTSVLNPANANKNTALDNFYGAKITPFGAFINNANVKISMSMYAPDFPPSMLQDIIVNSLNLPRIS